ncbi:MAG TPA: aminotransferase class IV [Flavobacterium sp.]|jgi:branched-chain amino acid aminotransferase
MINYNGNITSGKNVLSVENRGFLYGDGVFETVKIAEGRILFLEDHYFRLMSSMRILRMEIPMDFTMEFFALQIISLAEAEGCAASARARITVYRRDGGRYLPTSRNISFLVTAKPLEFDTYQFLNSEYEVDLYKDFFVPAQLLSTLKTTNRIINITGSIYAGENNLDNCLLLNQDKNVIEALNGNIFMLTANTLITPPMSDGCLNGIMRKQVLAIARKIPDLEVVEQSISTFDLQKGDELFITNVISGIRPVTKYRKKTYGYKFSEELTSRLNEMTRIS